MKVLEVANVDFSLRQFVLPLMRAAREAGHEVIGVSADGPLLADLRAEGFRVETIPFARNLSPRAHLTAFLALRRLIRAERPGMVHAHMPISGFLARLAARSLGVRRIAYTCHGFLFKQEGSRARRAVAFAMEWLGGRLTDECIAFAQAAGYQRMMLWTQSNLTAARAFYAARGFALKKSEPNEAFGQSLVSEIWERRL